MKLDYFDINCTSRLQKFIFSVITQDEHSVCGKLILFIGSELSDECMVVVGVSSSAVIVTSGRSKHFLMVGFSFLSRSFLLSHLVLRILFLKLTIMTKYN